MVTARELIRAYHVKPDKHLGQSFLEDKNIINKIVSLSDIRNDETIVEIGAGLGLMTNLLSEKSRKIIALEIDPRLVGVLKEELKGRSNVEVVHADVLEYDFSAAFSNDPPKHLKVIGNIPYNISSQILFRLINFRQYIGLMVLMFQKEVADRIMAQPGTKEYGILSVIVSMYAGVSREMNIPSSCFYPRPKVVSSLLKVIIREKSLVELVDHDFFLKIVKTAFSKRRKTLINNLKTADWLKEKDVDRALKSANIDGQRRGETLSVIEFGVLSQALMKSKK
jgi:16S rRNA (adenine1518-N6/adenine1519-N6)-dimethyltransferase